jgi:hypothetical protein
MSTEWVEKGMERFPRYLLDIGDKPPPFRSTVSTENDPFMIYEEDKVRNTIYRSDPFLVRFF